MPPLSIPAAAFPIVSTTLSFTAIAVAYVQSLALGTVQPGLYNLPDITHCALTQPARGVFLTLFMPAVLCQAFSWLLGAWDATRAGALIGFAGCFLLVEGEAQLDEKHTMNWKAHLTGATGFFVFALVAMLLRARGGPAETARALRPKRLIAGFNLAVFAFDFVLTSYTHAPGWTKHLCEWLLACSVGLYQLTFVPDLKGARVVLKRPGVSAGDEALLPAAAINNAC